MYHNNHYWGGSVEPPKPEGLHITYENGKIRAFQPDGTEVKGIKSASIQLNENGMAEVLLYFGIKTMSLHDVKRGSDGVRETRE